MKPRWTKEPRSFIFLRGLAWNRPEMPSFRQDPHGQTMDLGIPWPTWIHRTNDSSWRNRCLLPPADLGTRNSESPWPTWARREIDVCQEDTFLHEQILCSRNPGGPGDCEFRDLLARVFSDSQNFPTSRDSETTPPADAGHWNTRPGRDSDARAEISEGSETLT